jgi:hypothetical protein
VTQGTIQLPPPLQHLTYIGALKDGKPHGSGKIPYPDQEHLLLYDGMWKGGRKLGLGRQWNYNTEAGTVTVNEGQFASDVAYGYGLLWNRENMAWVVKECGRFDKTCLLTAPVPRRFIPEGLLDEKLGEGQ